jgi:hypothetical protein
MMQGHLVLIQQTAEFIRDSPTTVILTRRVKANDGAGGSTYTDAPVPAQDVRIVRNDESAAVERENTAGSVVRPEWSMIAMPDADVVRGDVFTYQGLNVEVVWINDLGYELMADVAMR